MIKFWHILTNPFSTPLDALQRAWKELWKPLCRHETVYIQRRHRNTVQGIPAEKLLFVDRYEVHNFVKCSDCGECLNVDRKRMRFNRIYEQRIDE